MQGDGYALVRRRTLGGNRADRREDIPALAEYFLEKYNKKRNKTIRGISKRAMETILGYEWPGNIRELENAIERAVVLTYSETIQPSDLTYYGPGTGEETFQEETLEEMEKEHIAKMLAIHNGHKVKTAKGLGIDRKTLRHKMRKYGIDS